MKMEFLVTYMDGSDELFTCDTFSVREGMLILVEDDINFLTLNPMAWRSILVVGEVDL